ncbi:FxSxx-COOH system tetratricopeptide repeat protein [Streptomyces sp. CMB-StM0423]|uniref:FxSxx-COOH system tetratricopeptide repeat protein n=1 Tax=Streptomyces sp. CMB-StM0423 TaxID=2059884 RepID=UPI00131B4D02|nr:FxSxx-COOH system tetratricopeptide repeat protein [Streptomyces sp. CMB-StM0423]
MTTGRTAPDPPPEPLHSEDLSPNEVADALWLAMCLAGRTRPPDRLPPGPWPGGSAYQRRAAPPPGRSGRPEPRHDQPGPGDPRHDGRPYDEHPRGEHGRAQDRRPVEGRLPGHDAGGLVPDAGLSLPLQRTSPPGERFGGGHGGPGEAGAWHAGFTGPGGPGSGGPSADHVPAEEAPVAWPAVPGLTDHRLLERSLRPLRRTVPSVHATELDEEATADALVEPEPRLPRFRPARERWLDLVLVVDAGASMAVWRHTVAEFSDLLRSIGAFRTVTVRLLDTDAEQDSRLALRGPGSGGPAYGLLDPAAARRRIVMVLTDGIGPAWRSGAGQRLVTRWGESVPVVITHLLSHLSWHRTWLGTRPARLRASGLRIVAEPAEPWLAAGAEAGAGAGAGPEEPVVPVVGLEPRWLGRWAQLLTGERGEWAGARVLSAVPEADDDEVESSLPTPAERVVGFRAAASPVAFRLARHLAVAPLSLPVMEMVQFFAEPGSRPADLAEVITSGLLVATEAAAAGDAALDTVRYTFLPGVAEELLASGRRTETAEVMRRVIDHLTPSLPELRKLGEVLAEPSRVAGEVRMPAGDEHWDYYAPVVRALHALSGPYRPWAGRLSSLRPSGDAPVARSGGDSRSRTAPVDKSVTLRYEAVAVPENPLIDPGTPAEAAESPLSRNDSGASDLESGATVGRHLPRPGVVERAIADRRKSGSPPPVWGNVPPRNVNFIGRVDALRDLHNRLTQGTTAVLPETLHGMGGVGKTQIAIEYAYRHSSEYDIVWWIPAGQPAQIRAGYVDLAQRLRLPTGAEANTAIPAVLEALRLGEPYRNWLLVFDNAENPESVLPFFPQGGTGRILVTSRNGQWVNMARTIEVDVFARDESVALLRRRGPELTDRQADHLSEELGDLPLAIEQAAVWLAETGMPAEEYLELFQGKRAEFVNRRSELLELAPPMDYQLPVAAAWNVSLDRLRDTNPAALQLLQVCAYFAPEPVSRTLFMAGRNASLPGLLGDVLSDPIRLGHALREVNRYALARIDHRTNSIQLHRLVQAVLIDQMTEDERVSMRDAAHLLMAGGDPREPGVTANWARYAELLPHIRASDAVKSEDRWVRGLVANTVVYLYTWGDHEACRELGTEALTTWRQTHGPDDSQALSVARHVGHALRSLGRYDDAAELNKDSLDRLRRIAGESHEDTLLAARAVAVDLRAAGDFESSVKLNKDTYDRAMRSFGERDPYTLGSAVDYGTALRTVGDFQTARDLDAVTLQLAVEVLGENALLTLLLGSLLAVDLRECGDYVGASEVQEINSTRFAQLAGIETPATLLAMRHLGVARRKAGDHEGALEACHEAWQRYRRRYGDDHFDTQCASSSLAIAQRQAGQVDEARRTGQDLLERLRRNLGDTHPYTYAVGTNLAVALRHLGETDQALALDQEAVDGLTSTLGPEHPYTLAAAINLASDLSRQGRDQAAAELDEDTYRRTHQALGASHPTTLACALNLAADLRTLGKSKRAETLYAAALSSMRQSLGQAHPATTAATRGDRADCDAEVMVI